MTAARRGLLLLVVAGLVLTACGGDSEPDTFSDYPDPLRHDDYLPALTAGLPQGEDPPPTSAVPVLQRNFLEGCITGGREGEPFEELLDENGAVRTEALVRVCGCSYYGIRDYYLGLFADLEPEEQQRRAVDRFRGVNSEFAGDQTTPIPAELNAIVAGCIRSEAGA